VGRQVIGQSADYGRLKNLFAIVVFTGLILAFARYLISKNLAAFSTKNSSENKNSITPVEPNSKTYRPVIASKGSLVPKVVRSEHNYLPLMDMNDRGDYLFLASPVGASYREFLHFYKSKSVSSGRLAASSRWSLTPNGNVVKRVEQQSPFGAGRINGGMVSWAFNELRFYRRFTDDGSMIFVDSNLNKSKQLTAKLVKDRIGSETKIYYTASFPLNILEIEENETIWFKKSFGQKSEQRDELLKASGGKVETVPYPTAYSTVDRVAATGSIMTATFGSPKGKEPVRSFVRQSNGWKELPIPPGFIFSYVQKAFNNGLILGFVTDQNRAEMKQVVWKEDSVAILNDLPAWPKLGQFSFVTRATRNGNIYVRSVLSTDAGTSENYLLNIGL
jgi:hypothetical protein